MKSTLSHRPRRLAAIASVTVSVTLVAIGLLPGASATAATSSAVADASKTPSNSQWSQRAVSAYDSLQDNLYLGATGHGLYREDTADSSGRPYSFLWESREATQAALDLQGIPGIGPAFSQAAAHRLTGLHNYFSVSDTGAAGYESYLPAPLGTGGDVYFDDNDVVGLSMFREYQASGDPAYLTKARAAFTIVTRGWSTDASLACPGGMNWIDVPTNTVRGANVTGLAAQLAAHLYETTHDGTYLQWSTKLFNWNNKCLKQSAGLYKNSRNSDGTVDPTLWSYNSGAMIATATILYRATGDPDYLTQAKRAAAGSLAYWTTGNRLQQQPAIFNAFYFQDLLLLGSVSADPSYRTVIENYATATWENNRDATTGLFHFQPSGGGNADWSRPAATLDQAAMIQIFAALAWNPRALGTIG